MFPVYADRVCIIAPAAERVPQWMGIFKCFSLNVWISLPVVTCFCGFVWYFIKVWNVYKRKKFRKNPNEQNYVYFSRVFIQTWMVMLGETTTMPEQGAERLFIATCLLANVIIIGTFQVSSPLSKKMF